MPPSPRLSARMMKTMYFTATTVISSHTIIDNKPRTFSGVGAIENSFDVKHCWRA